MSNYQQTIYAIESALLDAQEDGTVGAFEDYYNTPVKNTVLDSLNEEQARSALIDFYKLYDGFSYKWSSEAKESIGGRISFMRLQHVFQDWEGRLFDSEDIEENDLIQYFHPFDLITEEAQCGILIGQPFEDSEIYYNESGSPETDGLDVDFAGYLQMAYESRVFMYWPKVLLDIQTGEESVETKRFKEHMPQIFPDFTWENYLAIYESLRLSNNS